MQRKEHSSTETCEAHFSNDEAIDFLHDLYSYPFDSRIVRLNPSSRTMALGPTQPLTEMSTRNLPGGTARPALKAENLTDISEAIV
jgi:hypothetical protein